MYVCVRNERVEREKYTGETLRGARESGYTNEF